jgi:hypothetical protein
MSWERTVPERAIEPLGNQINNLGESLWRQFYFLKPLSYYNFHEAYPPLSASQA